MRLLRSIRLRLTVLAGFLVAAVLIVVAVLLVVVQRRQLTASLDGSLDRRADEIVVSYVDPDDDQALEVGGADRFVQILDPQGDVVVASRNLGQVGALVDPPSSIGQRTITRSDIPIEDDVFRILVRRFATPEGDRVVVVGENIDEMQDAMRGLSSTLALVIPLAVGALGAVVWWLVGRALQPVELIRSEVASIGGADLDHRVSEPGTRDEIDRLAGTMNEMLGRVQLAHERQQQFVADASHELRSPLTRIRAELEVDLAGAGTDLRATAESVLDETTELQHLTENLLYLARADARQARPKREPIDLDDLVLAAVRRLRERGSIEVDMTDVSAAAVVGDAGQLARLLRNLTDNAARHASSSVTVALRETGDVVTLIVDDDGPGVPADDRERVFERFTRLDEARTSDAGGSGLGLAICQEIVRAHGGDIAITDAPGGGARLEVTLPLGGCENGDEQCSATP